MNRRVIFTVINDLTYDQRMNRICSSLAEHDYDVLLVGRKLKSSIPLETKSYQQQRLSLLLTNGKLFYLEYNLRLFFFLLFKKFDIICGIDLDTILPGYFISKLTGKKCVYDAHEIFSEVPEVIRRPATQKIWKWVEKFSARRISNCYTVSEGVAEYFFQSYGRKFEVIKNVPLKITLPNESKTTGDLPKILYQGAINEGRGIEAMIEAMKEIQGTLVLAGDGDLTLQLKKQVNEWKMSDKIIFTGKKKLDELQTLALEATIGINLLQNKGLNYYYSLANKFFDYVQSGLPQITMNFPEYKKMNSQFEVAILVNDLKKETIIDAVNKLLHEKDFYFRLRENCLRAREEWNWEKEEQKLLSFYQQL